MRHTVKVVQEQGGTVVGFVVALDRMEGMEGDGEGGGRSAMGHIREELGVPAGSIATLDDLISVLRDTMGDGENARRLDEYRGRYRAEG